tara:strand:- start:350 stop:757 length:408 start_codon:yes stop_codon:yes gene_type:complete
MAHWATDFLGKSWEAGARGPETFDCFGLLSEVYRIYFCEILPVYPFNPQDVVGISRTILTESRGNDWTAVNKPQEFDAVGMGKKNSIHHVGIWTNADGGKIVHASDGKSVMIQSIAELTRLGFGRIEFYRHASCN